MKGIGRATAAITFVNALPTGIGAAAGIDLPVEATVELDANSPFSDVKIHPDSDTPLVRAIVAGALDRWGSGRGGSVRVRVRSGIPQAQGLKSSSAVAGAVARGLAAALGVRPGDVDVATLGADIAQSIGLSATGAFDDGMAALSPGIHVTENLRRQPLRRDPIPSDWGVVLWIPHQNHRPSPNYTARFRELSRAGEIAGRLALSGNPLSAMSANTRLVEEALGLDYAPIRKRLLEGGARGAGISGMGPTLAVIVDDSRLANALRALPRGQAEIIVARFSMATGGTAS